jgi:hypothetical protein
MKRVQITFYLEPSDSEHSTGLTTEHYDEINNTIMGMLGGDDIEIEVVEEAETDEPIRKLKPKRGQK